MTKHQCQWDGLKYAMSSLNVTSELYFQFGDTSAYVVAIVRPVGIKRRGIVLYLGSSEKYMFAERRNEF